MPKLHVPYLKWREGRPRFEPGPSLRARGFRGQDLKDAHGSWLRTRGQAADAIDAILQHDSMGGTRGAVRRALAPQQQTLSELFRLFAATGFTRKQKPLAVRTREGYDGHRRLLETWAGDFPVRDITRDAIKELHRTLAAHRGLATANAVHRTLSAALNYAVEDLEWLPKNRAAKLATEKAPGRLVLWEPDEINTLVAVADWAGMDAVGDAIVLALYSGQNLSDLLAFPELTFPNGYFQGCRNKTKVAFFIPPFTGLTQRLAIARVRKARTWPNVRFEREIVAPDGTAYDANSFGKEFRLVRALASGAAFAIEDALRGFGGLPPKLRNLPFTPAPAIQQKNFQDLRDTAVTWLMEILGNIVAVIKITGHSLKSAQAIIDKHYLVRRALSAEDAATLDAAYIRKMGG